MNDAKVEALAAKLSPPVDADFARQLVEEYRGIERRFRLRDWRSTELDGGRFAEILARILYHLDSGNLAPGKGYRDCKRRIENTADPNLLHDLERHTGEPKSARHLFRAADLLSDFRSEWDVAHPSLIHEVNAMDARITMEAARWCFAEVLRLFWKNDREAVATAIQDVLRFDVPCIGEYHGRLLVERAGIDPLSEVRLLLYHAGSAGLDRAAFGVHARCKPPDVTKALGKLSGPKCREIEKVPGSSNSKTVYLLTNLGVQRAREDLGEFLVV